MVELLTLLSPALGAIARLLPSVLDLFHKKQDNAHELAMLDKQVELAKVQSERKVAEITAQGADTRATLASQTDAAVDGNWSAGLLDAIRSTSVLTGIKSLDALNQSVRPVLTYWWCVVLYTSAKAVGIAVALENHADLASLTALLVTDFDCAVIGSMLGFWFVDRSLRKLGR